MREELDFNNNGRVTPGELRFYIAPLGLSDDDFITLWNLWDVDKDGWLSMNELMMKLSAKYLESTKNAVSKDGKKLVAQNKKQAASQWLLLLVKDTISKEKVLNG